MNALAAACCVAMLFAVIHTVTDKIEIAIVFTAIFAFSRAFVLHATNAAEPIMGLFWAFLSVLVVMFSLAHRRSWVSIAGGFMLAFAMATYESMVLIAPALVLMIWGLPGMPRPRAASYLAAKRIAWFCAGYVLGILSIYGVSYRLSGIHGFRNLVAALLQPGGEPRVYGGVTIAKVVNIPVGLAGSLLPCLPQPYHGIRSLFSAGGTSLITALLASGIVAAAAIWLIWSAARRWRSLSERRRLALACCGAGIAFTFVPLAVWDPVYDKLWLEPLACILVTSSIVVSDRLEMVRARRAGIALSVLVAASLIVMVNFTIAVRDAIRPTPYLVQAREVRQSIGPRDLLISGWDSISLLYVTFWNDGHGNNFNLVTSASINGSVTSGILKRRIQLERERGGRVFFLGVLDLPEGIWGQFLGEKCGLPYHTLDGYRDCARVVRWFDYGGSKISLRELPNADCFSSRKPLAHGPAMVDSQLAAHPKRFGAIIDQP
ncbi:MAG: hypothetical protein ACREQ4_06535 [Candidatus Binataceae bacterium]